MANIIVSNTIGVEDGDILVSSPIVIAKTHTHTLDSIIGVSDMMMHKSDTGHTHVISELIGLDDEVARFIKENTTLINQTQLTTAIANKAIIGHGHAISDITGLATELSGVYKKPITGIPLIDLDQSVSASIASVTNIGNTVSTLQTDLNLIKQNLQGSGGSVTFGYIKPLTGIPISDLASTIATTLANADIAIPKIDAIITSLASKDNIGHTHTINNITGLQTILSTIYSKPIGGIPVEDLQPSIAIILDNANSASVTIPLLESKITKLGLEKSTIGHTHNVADITELSLILASKSALGHSHSISQIDGLQTVLDTLYVKPSSGIPASHLASDVLSSLPVFDNRMTVVESSIANIQINKSNNGHIHDIASSTTNGFLSSTDKIKLDGIEVNATKNSSDTALRDRTFHSGTQSISTIDNLQTILDSKYVKLDTGIPKIDLNSSIQSQLSAIDTISNINIPDIYSELSKRSTLSHGHSIVDISGLQTALDSKYELPVSGIAKEAFTTTLQTSLAAYENAISNTIPAIQQAISTIGNNNYITNDTAWSGTSIVPIAIDWSKVTDGISSSTTSVTFDNKVSTYGIAQSGRKGDKFWVSGWTLPRGGTTCNYPVYIGIKGMNAAGIQTEFAYIKRMPTDSGALKLEGSVELIDKNTVSIIPCIMMDVPIGTWATGTAKNGIHVTDLFFGKMTVNESIIDDRIVDIQTSQHHLYGMVMNGAATMCSNYGFDLATFDGTDSPPGFDGSFKFTGMSQVNIHSSVMKVDPGAVYELSAYVKSINGAKCYIGLQCLDGDMNIIGASNIRILSNTLTTLTAPLSINDTTISVANASSWTNTTTTGNADRVLGIFGYKSSQGKLYSPNTEKYTRIVGTSNQWSAGGISNNVITLSAPLGNTFANPAVGSNGIWPIGTSIGQMMATGSSGYNYRLAANYSVPSNWMRLSSMIGGGTDMSGLDDFTYFRPGTQYVQILVLSNWGTDTSMNIAGVYFNRTSVPRSAVI
jgi:Phage tail repeat like